MPVPADDSGPTLDELDTTVTIDQVRGLGGPWPVQQRVTAPGGRALVVLRSRADRVVALGLVLPEHGVVVEYPVAYDIAPVRHHTFDGDTFPSMQDDGDGTTPLLFAVRLRPFADASDAQVVQLAVYRVGSSLRVAERGLRDAAWSPLLRVDFPPGVAILGLQTVDPH